MEGKLLRHDQWEKAKPFVPGGRKGRRSPRSDGRSRRYLRKILNQGARSAMPSLARSDTAIGSWL
jgi:hypothetical protein